MTSRKILLPQNCQLDPKFSIFKVAENHYGAQFYMGGQNSNAYNLYIVGKKILLGLVLSLELGYCELLIKIEEACSY